MVKFTVVIVPHNTRKDERRDYRMNHELPKKVETCESVVLNKLVLALRLVNGVYSCEYPKESSPIGTLLAGRSVHLNSKRIFISTDFKR